LGREAREKRQTMHSEDLATLMMGSELPSDSAGTPG
jgi:hypothetical protein